MKKIIKTTAFFLAVLFAFSPLTGGVLNLLTFAEDTIESPLIPILPPSGPGEQEGLVYVFDDENATAKVTDYFGTETAIVVPKTVEDGEKVYTVTEISVAAFSAVSSVKSIALADSIVKIGAFAFDSCAALTDVWYEGDETAFAAIAVDGDGNEAFANAAKHFDACMESAGPDFVHTYDAYNDADCNACGKAREVEEYIPGDVDGSEGVDIDDAIHLLFSFYYPERYPVNQSVDFDKSGSFDFDDIFYLLYHINFPDRYPLS